LDRGSVAAAVAPKKKGQSFVIQSGEFEVSVIGTRFRVSHGDGALRVEVAHGHVRVRSPRGEWDVLDGQTLSVDPSGEKMTGFERKDFDELSATPLAEPPDAGAPAELDADAGTTEPDDAAAASEPGDAGAPGTRRVLGASA